MVFNVNFFSQHIVPSLVIWSIVLLWRWTRLLPSTWKRTLIMCEFF